MGKFVIEVERKNHKLGSCTECAAVNFCLFELVKMDMVYHYIIVWCHSHGIELAIKDAFDSTLSASTQKNLQDVYNLLSEQP